LVFVANALGAVKLLMNASRDLGNASRTTDGEGGFKYFYHVDSHNSVVGVREALNDNNHCFANDTEVEQ
jgi:molybdenum cofactor sulfurtransferase